jgi:hypothetical protein
MFSGIQDEPLFVVQPKQDTISGFCPVLWSEIGFPVVFLLLLPAFMKRDSVFIATQGTGRSG